MLNLVTKLNTSLGPVLREELDTNFEKIEQHSGNVDTDVSKALLLANNANSISNDTKERLANVITGQEQPSEVVDARHSSIENKEYDTLTDRLNNIEKYQQTAKNSSWIYNNIKTLSAHRGAHIDAPENTAMAVAHAGMYGYGLIECDPRLTSDNQVVLMHDDTVDRMTDGAGNVSNFTLGQLKQLTVDAAFSGKNDYNTIRVPTLAEVLHEVNLYGMGVNIDGSKLDWQDDNVINTVVGIIKQAGLMGRSFFVISDSVARKRLNALYPEATLTWLNYDTIDNYIAEAETYKNAVISIDYGNLSRDYSAIAASGLPLHVYNVNLASQYDDSVQHGARFVETDSLLPMTVTQA